MLEIPFTLELSTELQAFKSLRVPLLIDASFDQSLKAKVCAAESVEAGVNILRTSNVKVAKEISEIYQA